MSKLKGAEWAPWYDLKEIGPGGILFFFFFNTYFAALRFKRILSDLNYENILDFKDQPVSFKKDVLYFPLSNNPDHLVATR